MNWKVRFRELTGWRPKNNEERTKNDEERLKIFAKSPTKTSRKRYGSASTWIFFTETIFLTIFKWFSDTRRVEHFCSSLLPLFIGKWGRSLPPSSPRRARLLPPKGTAFWRTSWKAQVGLVVICTPYLLNTPPAFFADSFSVTLRNFTTYVTILVFLSVMSRNLTDYVFTLF